MQLAFDILSWGGWTPDFQDNESWCHWQSANQSSDLNSVSPSLVQVPAMQRRRFSRLTKMMLTVAFECQATQLRSVFASRHGELNRTIGLLEDVISKTPLSPMAFSQSVHNTASGIYGIVNNNTACSTSIAAGAQSLPQALIETFAQIKQYQQPILLVFGDDPVPPVYNEFINEVELPIALGLVLDASATKSANAIAQLTIDSAKPNITDNKICLSELIHHIASGKNIQGEMCHWQWNLHHYA
ncbi:beta-ketoacyl synthase chain length factor [Shewanella aestuarii]|uniref:Beta-ketoacyl synthase chain length factor n=1 Tax=Shewanella aestuarii TaxID=1028752 RepID=A0A6G9QGW4_9GAMM|nr:beta-ketoacyl synthase chain length factor [Shewanella aestuarii]QIR13307.1 beta-ketoacyl synthase chain length factor [Shewanella aestuarii]